MMNIGLFFGSFNPIHIGHLALANYLVEFTSLDKIWFVISPHNPLKDKTSLINDHLRLEMAQLATEDDPRFWVCDIEFRMPQPSYTIDTLAWLSEKYPEYTFHLILGEDGLETFHKWKNQDVICKKYHRYVYPRHVSATVDYSVHSNLTLLRDAPRIEVSSSFIRSAFKSGKDVRHFLPQPVYDFIEKYHVLPKSR